jgi:hypothetical protein
LGAAAAIGVMATTVWAVFAVFETSVIDARKVAGRPSWRSWAQYRNALPPSTARRHLPFSRSEFCVEVRQVVTASEVLGHTQFRVFVDDRFEEGQVLADHPLL